ncbi:hypothetical protein [Streptomyces erythrochromogenes]|uniref:hypothetical protein n=1 Tax=Streptomyces erythrochromogenes TaxID=285574 RepID=UPI00031AB640
MLALQDLLPSLDEQPAEGLIYAAKPWTATSVAAGAALGGQPPGLGRLLEVEPVYDGVELWSSWRYGARPTAAENCEEVIHYAEYDAYLGVRS